MALPAPRRRTAESRFADGVGGGPPGLGEGSAPKLGLSGAQGAESGPLWPALVRLRKNQCVTGCSFCSQAAERAQRVRQASGCWQVP